MKGVTWMQNGSFASLGAEANDINCAFCQRSKFAANILKETGAFFIIADHAPLVEGHILIIPKRHFACYGTVPAETDDELFALKREVQDFFARYYAPVIFWEHGIFRQTVFHAHLHCFPFGAIEYDATKALHSLVVHSQDDIRSWYATHGHYFYMEDQSRSFLFEPEIDGYLQVIKDVLWRGVSSRSQQSSWRSQQQRYIEGAPLIKETIDRWFEYQRLGADYADETSSR
jgi:diadenosine tetraphosphate (Ap4A) HIT family hydrolase